MGSSVLLPTPGQPKTGPDAGFTTGAIPNVVTFGLDRIAPPSPQYIQRDDVLFIEVTSSIVDTVAINWRELMAPFPRTGQPDHPGGGDPTQTAQSSNIINQGQRIVAIGAGQVGTPQIVPIPLSEGYLLSIVATSASALQRGQTYARVGLNRGPSAALPAQTYLTLFADYVTQFHSAGWPNGRVIYPSESSGAIVPIILTNPGAGNDFSFLVPAFARWRVQSLSGLFTTSAVVANRTVHIQVQTGAPGIVWDAASLSVQAASLGFRYSAGNGIGGQVATDNSVIIPLPNDLVLGPSHKLVSSTTNKDAGDAWTGLVALVEQWLETV